MDWISMKDRLPEDSQRVIICDDDYKNIWICFFIKDKQKFMLSAISDCPAEFSVNRVTHWMPLPESPQDSFRTKFADDYKNYKYVTDISFYGKENADIFLEYWSAVDKKDFDKIKELSLMIDSIIADRKS